MTEGWQFSARADRTEHPALRWELLCHLSGYSGPSLSQFFDSLGNSVFRKIGEICSESVRFDYFGPSLEILTMDSGNKFRSCDVQYLVAAF